MSEPKSENSKAAVFEKTYQDYLSRIADVDLKKRAEKLKCNISDNEMVVPIFGAANRVSPAGIMATDGVRAGFAESIVIFKFILMCPENESLSPEPEWQAYHSFKDAQPLIQYFRREVTKPIEDCFSGNLNALEQAGKTLGGVPAVDNAAYDLSMRFDALPTIPMFLRFNDQDEDFPAQCTILFSSCVERRLDMESLGILGALFSNRLIKNALG